MLHTSPSECLRAFCAVFFLTWRCLDHKESIFTPSTFSVLSFFTNSILSLSSAVSGDWMLDAFDIDLKSQTSTSQEDYWSKIYNRFSFFPPKFLIWHRLETKEQPELKILEPVLGTSSNNFRQKFCHMAIFSKILTTKRTVEKIWVDFLILVQYLLIDWLCPERLSSIAWGQKQPWNQLWIITLKYMQLLAFVLTWHYFG